MKIMLIGYGRHGKDTVAEYLHDKYGMSFQSSSLEAAEKIMMPYFASKGIYYQDAQTCFEDRHRDNNRAVWFDEISRYNSKGPQLTRDIYEKSDIYVGARSWKEFTAAKNEGLFDVALWVDRSDHVPPESESSMTIKPWMADFIIDNNGTLEDLYRNVDTLMFTLNGIFN